MSKNTPREIPTLIVHQWLNEWDEVTFSKPKEKGTRHKPEPHFYLFSLQANLLRKLSGIYRRNPEIAQPRAEDPHIERPHSAERSELIRNFIHGGFPWSDVSERQQRSEEYRDLRMPGWLPTAIVANIVGPDRERRGKQIRDEDRITLGQTSDQNIAKLVLPERYNADDWIPSVRPLEIIDGQHRLLALSEDEELDGEFQLPVVAFYDLDITWQAYLFYTINIKPTRIKSSLAFDLYPLLRVQDWLEKSPDGPLIYRETRAQELTEMLWSHPESPWRERINMLGEKRKKGEVTQAAFIRSLLSSYVKRWEGHGMRIGGLFGTSLNVEQPDDILQWTRPQQAAFLILVWQSIKNAVCHCDEEWAESLREEPKGQIDLLFDQEGEKSDLAFAGSHSLLATDQGVRGILSVTNDMCYVSAKEQRLDEWESERFFEETVMIEAVTAALHELREKPIKSFLEAIATELTLFDWRTSAFPGFSREQQDKQAIYRGSSGYRALRLDLVQLLKSAKARNVSKVATEVAKRIGM